MTRTLRVAIPRQDAANWCWAAVGLGIHQFYWAPAAFSTQCQVASRVIGNGNCCADPRPCDVMQQLERALGATRTLGAQPILGPVRPDFLMQQIDSGRPLCAHITWPFGGPQHFITIAGYSLTPELLVAIQDPLRPARMYRYSDLLTNYERGGQWDFTYVTARQGTS
jgi:hypothetical protein